MKRIKSIFLFLAVSFISIPVYTQQYGEVYEPCCGASPVEFSHEGAYVYVPNVFTPNGDGVNDYFRPYINNYVLEIVDFIIYDPATDSVLYDQPTLDFNDINNYAWNGLRKDGTVYEGLFRYEMLATLRLGGLMKIEGRACRIVCGPDAQIFQTKTGCMYPVQVDEQGVLDTTLSNQETACFN